MFLKGNISIGQTLLYFDFPEGFDGRVINALWCAKSVFNITSVSFEVKSTFFENILCET